MKIMVSQLRTKINDMENDNRNALRQLVGKATYVVIKEAASGKEENLSDPYDFMKGLGEVDSKVDKLMAAKAALAKFNNDTRIPIPILGGKTMSIQQALFYLAELRQMHNMLEGNLGRYSENKQRRNDGGMNSTAYYQITRLNYSEDDLKAKLDAIRNTINELSAAVDKANTAEIDVDLD